MFLDYFASSVIYVKRKLVSTVKYVTICILNFSELNKRVGNSLTFQELMINMDETDGCANSTPVTEKTDGIRTGRNRIAETGTGWESRSILDSRIVIL